VYTLTYPLYQSVLTLLWLPTVLAVLWLKLPVLTALVSFLPLYALLFQLLTTVVGAVIFAREYGVPFPLFMPLSMAISFLPYQFLLGISSVRAVYREVRQVHNWEKTAHVGAHRQPVSVSFTDSERSPSQEDECLGAARGHQ
jgi:hypothetical protein